MRYFLSILFLLNLWIAPATFAASKAETKSFQAAVVELRLKVYDLAEKDFAKFVEEHPDSTNRVSALFHQAEARFFQTNYTGALELLQSGLSQAGAEAHNYQYLIAQSLFESGNFRGAADAYAALTKNFSDSVHFLDACYGEALSESKLGHWTRVIELLQTPDGKFQSAAKIQPNNSAVVDGCLLLAEAFLKESRFKEGEKVLAQLEGRATVPGIRWRQNYLLCRIQMAANSPGEALATTTNLVSAAQESGNPRQFAESIFLRGEILEKLNRLPEAAEAYQQNLSEETPANLRQQSFFRTVALDLAQGNTTNAIQRLEKFVAENSATSALDLARVTLGELRLKQYVSQKNSSAMASNLFEQAFTNFTMVITNSSANAQVGKAFLDRGWCFWLQENFRAAEADFFQATQRLPISEDKAVARFKLADTQFRQTNYAAAVTNYQLLIENYPALQRITNSLFEPALYQTLRASLAIGNTAAATDAMHKLLDWFPNGTMGAPSVLLVGADLARANKESEARELFVDFLKRVPNSPRDAEVKLAIAQTYVEERNWVEAVKSYDAWVTNFAAHPLLPKGEFARALAYDKAGMETNAFILFTNFVARFPSDRLAALGQNWVADFYWNHEDYRNAEKSYQELYQKFDPAAELGYHGRLMAGRAAYDRSDYTEAAKYFGSLIEMLERNSGAPVALKGEAYFALGDTWFQDFLASTNTNDLNQAITALTRITKEFPTNSTVYPLAWGRIGDCYFQLAGQDAAQSQTRYKQALDSYGMVIDSTVASAAARSQAEVGVGKICEKRAAQETGKSQKDWINAALEHYMNVVTERTLREGETFDAKWMYEAGIATAKIYENSEQWEQALNIYQQLAELLPPLRPSVERKIALVRTRMETVKN